MAFTMSASYPDQDASSDNVDEVKRQSKRSYADLNRDRWIQSPEC